MVYVVLCKAKRFSKKGYNWKLWSLLDTLRNTFTPKLLKRTDKSIVRYSFLSIFFIHWASCRIGSVQRDPFLCSSVSLYIGCGSFPSCTATPPLHPFLIPILSHILLTFHNPELSLPLCTHNHQSTHHFVDQRGTVRRFDILKPSEQFYFLQSWCSDVILLIDTSAAFNS